MLNLVHLLKLRAANTEIWCEFWTPCYVRSGELIMKVFEVICEYCQGDSKEITTERQYVTSEEGTLKSVTDYFTQHCLEYDKDLLGVREVLTIVQHIVT